MSGLGWGGDYNPEQWSPEVWREDVKLMRQAGVNIVSVGIFSWALIEVEDGRYEFGWLDEVMDLLHANDIRVDLATATAAPPPWLTHQHPEMLPVRSDGTRLWPGSRQSYCPSSLIYRHKAVALATRMAEHYRDHPALAGWHVNNEYGCHVWKCYCDNCAVAFRDWLRERYDKDLDRLNESWGTAFWSQRYSDWDQVLPPRDTPTFRNPGQQIDFARYSSDALLELYKAERDALRAITPDVPITTNFMVAGALYKLDYWSWASEVDFVSNDHYVAAEDPERHIELAFSADLTRGLAGGRPWLLMEHSTSAVNWQPRNVAKRPGEARRHTYAHLARGADGTLFFQWRQSKAGAERYHSGMVPHAGPDTKVFREVCQVGAEFGRASELLGSTVDASVAIVFDPQSWWLAEQETHPTKDFSYLATVFGLYRALWQAGVTADFVPPTADADTLGRYPLLLVPALYAATDQTAARIADYVAAGGHALITWMSGISDERGHIRLGGYPGAFRDLLGVWTEEFFPLAGGDTVHLDNGHTAAVWTEWVHLRGAQAVASYTDGALPGVPALTRNTHGRGVAWYLACGLDRDGLRELVDTLLTEAGVEPVVAAPTGVEVVRRRGEHAGQPVSWLVVINHSAGDVQVPVSGVDVLSSARVSGELTVPAGDVVVLREDPREEEV
ncbi:beta-galactosidase [Goodfellowiella coeruleoviolacea]|uniref:Beta-galactosidase n=1 Tax=Goodfellowiella coeruleoviolacea TaxID=334858 RepID=A0AAE3GMI7_9PSEU|nr:beta-galactosidase [Goodfellowiella coeruleoviolacea]MCP2168703.1 beta-galactosidase [Goodfellowiella coeruleoviolacea]